MKRSKMSFCLTVTWLTAARNSNGLSFRQMLSFILIFQRKQICGSYCTTTRASWAVDRRMDGQALFTSAPARLPRTKSNNKLLLKLHVDITQSSSNSLTQPASFLFALLIAWYSDEPCLNKVKPFTGQGRIFCEKYVDSNSVIELKNNLSFEDFLTPMSFLKTLTIHVHEIKQRILNNCLHKKDLLLLTFTSQRFK